MGIPLLLLCKDAKQQGVEVLLINDFDVVRTVFASLKYSNIEYTNIRPAYATVRAPDSCVLLYVVVYCTSAINIRSCCATFPRVGQGSSPQTSTGYASFWTARA